MFEYDFFNVSDRGLV